MHKCIEVGGFLAEYLPALMRTYLDKPYSDHHKGNAYQCRRGKLCIFEEHNTDYRADCDKIRYQCRDTVGEYILQGIDVSDNAGKDFSCRPAVKKLEIQCLYMCVELLPDCDKYLVAHLCHNVHACLDQNNQNRI